MNMKNKIRLEIPLSEMLSPFSEKTARKIEAELKYASKPIRGGRRIRGERLFPILQRNQILHSRYKPSPQSLGTSKTLRDRAARKEVSVALIKSVLNANGNQAPKTIYEKYKEKAKAEGEKPYSYAWFQVICDGMQK